MGRKKSTKPKPPKINKQHLVERLVEKPTHGVREWLIKEYTILQNLAAKFPLDFLNQLTFRKKLASLAVLFCDDLMRDLTNRFRAYKYVPPVRETIILGEKTGEDFIIKKKPSLRDLLK